MKVTINRELKIKLLKALKSGYIETQEYPELQEVNATFQIVPMSNNGILTTFASDETEVEVDL